MIGWVGLVIPHLSETGGQQLSSSDAYHNAFWSDFYAYCGQYLKKSFINGDPPWYSHSLCRCSVLLISHHKEGRSPLSIVVKNLNFSYGNRKIIEDVSFTAEEGELLVILGPNGVGKSTLFQCILGLLPGYTGTITVNGDNARNIGIRELARRMAYIPQIHSPVFNYTVFDIVLMGTASQISEIGIPGKSISGWPKSHRKTGNRAFRDRAYTQISGGERQLVMIARALAQRQKFWLWTSPPQTWTTETRYEYSPI